MPPEGPEIPASSCLYANVTDIDPATGQPTGGVMPARQVPGTGPLNPADLRNGQIIIIQPLGADPSDVCYGRVEHPDGRTSHEPGTPVRVEIALLNNSGFGCTNQYTAYHPQTHTFRDAAANLEKA